jgi:hypothetical protein
MACSAIFSWPQFLRKSAVAAMVCVPQEVPLSGYSPKHMPAARTPGELICISEYQTCYHGCGCNHERDGNCRSTEQGNQKGSRKTGKRAEKPCSDFQPSPLLEPFFLLVCERGGCHRMAFLCRTLPACHEAGGRASCGLASEALAKEAGTRRERQPNWQRWLVGQDFHFRFRPCTNDWNVWR